MKVIVTGATGLLGWHTAVRLHAENLAARFDGNSEPYDLVRLDHLAFDDDQVLAEAVNNADAILHFAGVNRAADHIVEAANPEIARRLAIACSVARVRPHVVYANSEHATQDTPYGRSKQLAGEILADIGGDYTDMVLPHIFGECARPHYNNVTATFVDAVINSAKVNVNPTGNVSLVHAGEVAQAALNVLKEGKLGKLLFDGRRVAVAELFLLLQDYDSKYRANIFPDLSDGFAVDLFNTYRAALYPDFYPRSLQQNSDARGMLFEAFKGGTAGQCFASWTEPGVTRGNHFHLTKVERFLVLQGAAIIRLRRVLDDNVIEYKVSGDSPSVVDMPTLHTHSIENIGTEPLLTLFWTHELFDPMLPDTYADPVLENRI
jgi:UDP-2-acetamido-2,6-beta-L-arabino-hexul-4-ose reductase